jgi:hypothetical protein
MQTVNFDTNGKTVRTTLICTAEEWASILTAVQGERRKTVRSKRPVQQPQAKISALLRQTARDVNILDRYQLAGTMRYVARKLSAMR